MTPVLVSHIKLTPTQPVGSGRARQKSNLGPPDQYLLIFTQMKVLKWALFRLSIQKTKLYRLQYFSVWFLNVLVSN